jgi:hypothetical protein
MNEGVAVDELEGTGKRDEQRRRDSETGPRGKDEERPESLSPRENGIAHRPEKKPIVTPEETLEGLFDQSFLGRHSGF